jgi:hypothetical protein
VAVLLVRRPNPLYSWYPGYGSYYGVTWFPSFWGYGWYDYWAWYHP